MRAAETEWIHHHIKDVLSIDVAQEWALSTVLHVRTTRGDVFFKSSARLPLSADEPRLMRLLAQLYPNDLPPVYAVDDERGWMIMGDVGVNLRQRLDFDLWRLALLRLAQIQGDSISHIDQLLAAGCRDGRPSRLGAQVDTLLANQPMLSGLDADEVRRLRTLAPLLRQNCAELEQTTLVHGDFHAANIGYQDGSLCFFDWSESCIGHPFYDLPVILHDATAHFSPEQVAALRDAYLACWDDGARQWRIAAPVAALHHAMMYNGVAEFVNPDKPRVNVTRWLREILSHEP